MNQMDDEGMVARIAGNIAAGMVSGFRPSDEGRKAIASSSVALARAIVAEVKRTEPPPEDEWVLERIS